VTVYMEVAYLF